LLGSGILALICFDLPTLVFSCFRQTDWWRKWLLMTVGHSPWYPLPTTTATVIQEPTVARLSKRHHKSVEAKLDFSLGGQLPLSGRPHNPTTTTRLWSPSTTVVSP